jgi:aspartyl-tRNA(Asn)/glutamyl-tRNA(Gln) amidotransferase subunit B
VVQRFKESAEEYRYFPEPDLPIVEVSRDWVEAVRRRLPELPDAKRDRLMALGLTRYDASVLVAEKTIADYYEAAMASGAAPKALANWIIGDLFGLMNRANVAREEVGTINVTPEKLGALVKLVENGTINRATGVEVLAKVYETGDDPAAIVEREGLAQVSDTSAIDAAVREVLAANAPMVERYRAGEDKLMGPLMGMVMKKLAGKGNPQVVKDVVAAALKEG